MDENKKGSKKLIKLLIAIICILAIAVVVILALSNKEEDISVNLKSTLEKIVEKNQLETVTFTYNVIGKQCLEQGCDKTSNNVEDYKYVVSCKGTVTAGINFDNVKLNLNEEAKMLNVEIPEATITETNILATNFLNGDKLPASEIVSARELCKNTIQEKVNQDEELIEASKEQVRIILSTYYEKWVKALGNDYKVEVK